MVNRFRGALAGLLLSTLLAGCGDDNGPSQGFVVTGTIQNNNTGEPLPPNARLVVAWVVSSTSPDYSYVFGEGTLNASAGTFQVRLDQPPPAQALNSGVLGVGILLVTTSQSIANGDDVSSLSEEELIGAAGQYAIISVTNPDGVEGWAAQFEAGYSVGRGVEVPGDFDEFEPVSSSSVVLIVDDLENIDFVNWS
jgi:hypothetical protein